MRVFVTGATGFIGSVIVQELQRAGHEVLGLARSDASSVELAALDVAVHRGGLDDVDSLAAGARLCYGVIHPAFKRGWATTTREQAAETDRLAVEAMIGAMEGTGNPLVVTSGTALMTPAGRSLTEADVTPSPEGRARVEEIVVAAGDGSSGRRRGGALRFVRALRGDRQSDVECAHPRGAAVGATGSRSADGHAPEWVLRVSAGIEHRAPALQPKSCQLTAISDS